MKPIKVLAAARTQLQELPAALTAEESAPLLQQAIDTFAGADANRILSGPEAAALVDTCRAVAGDAAAPLTAEQQAALRSAVELRAQELRAQRPSTSRLYFTSEGRGVQRLRPALKDPILECVERARKRGAKQVDVNEMIFSFTDKSFGDFHLDMARRYRDATSPDDPALTVRQIACWSQLALSGSRQPSRLAKQADTEGLQNLQIKFKKDDPYVWDSAHDTWSYDHNKTLGLLHHKAYVVLVDGRPEMLVFGSLNWSVSAMQDNLENLWVLDRLDQENRPLLASFEAEFEGFWNNHDAALTWTEAQREKIRLIEEITRQHGHEPPSSRPVDEPSFAIPDYRAEDRSATFDINCFADADAARLEACAGKTLANAIHKSLREHGRFADWAELEERVAQVKRAPLAVRLKLQQLVEFGVGKLSINMASAAELDRAGLSAAQAKRVVDFRTEHGAFESLDELRAVAGIGAATVERAGLVMCDDELSATFSATTPGGQTTTGWAAEHQGTTRIPSEGDYYPRDAAGDLIPLNRRQMIEIARDMAAPCVDLFRRTPPGETVYIAKYGISQTSPEFRAMVDLLKRHERAAAQGVTMAPVKVEMVINDDYNSGAIDAIKALQAQGYDIKLWVIHGKVMHEKFGVTGDDCWIGSANWSLSSITKHTEDRVLSRNDAEVAEALRQEFARLVAVAEAEG